MLRRLRPAAIVLATLAAVLTSARAEQPDNSLTLDNRSGYLARIDVVGPSPHAVELAHGEQQTVALAAGEYHLVIHYAGREDEYADVRGESFRVEQTAASVSRVTITLHPVVGGNYLTWPIIPGDLDGAPTPARAALPEGPAPGESGRPGQPRSLDAGARVRLRLEENYGEARVASRLGETMTALLRAAGLEVLAADAISFDAALEIEVTGRALKRRYTAPGVEAGELRYSGADISGTLLLEGPGRHFFHRSFRQRVAPPPEILSGSHRSPDEAPFAEAIDRSELYRALGDGVAAAYGTEAEVNYWLRALEEVPLQGGAVNALAALGMPAVAPLVVRLGAEGALPDLAVRALGGLGGSAVEPLIATLRDERPPVRKRAAEALGRIGDARSVDPLLALVRDETVDDVRATAAAALGRMPDGVIGPLTSMLKDDSPELRRTAAEALGGTGDWRAVEPLIGALKGERVSIRSSVRDALRKLTREDFGLDHQAWLRWWEQHRK